MQLKVWEFWHIYNVNLFKIKSKTICNSHQKLWLTDLGNPPKTLNHSLFPSTFRHTIAKQKSLLLKSFPMALKRAPMTIETNTNKGKRLRVEENVKVHKRVTFDRCLFTTLELASRFNIHFANKTVNSGRNIDFSKLCYFQFDSLFLIIGWLPIISVKELVYPRGYKILLLQYEVKKWGIHYYKH